MADLAGVFSRFTWQSALDILLVALIFYGLLTLFRGTQAVQLLRGILVVILVITLAINVLELTAFTWLVRNSIQLVLVAIPVIFQPELRRALERLGRTAPIFGRPARESEASLVTSQIVQAARQLAETRHGALIILEGETGLEDYIEAGIRIDALVSAQLLQNLFYPNSPLHDGAVIIRGNRVMAAACVLPLAEGPLPDPTIGTRHRAAIGITEQTDALAVVVSEETGIISVARTGRIVRRLDERRLQRVLEAFYQPPGLFGGRLASGLIQTRRLE
ncbi:MAG TPA: TIGR00159 family protein [Anaerolineae bacterium]|nr:TIGR00159 family protein [Anaerolineae bacterium]HIQ06196.1 TIGR00159 family protein [Anaerolineae bacterium]